MIPELDESRGEWVLRLPVQPTYGPAEVSRLLGVSTGTARQRLGNAVSHAALLEEVRIMHRRRAATLQRLRLLKMVRGEFGYEDT